MTTLQNRPARIEGIENHRAPLVNLRDLGGIPVEGGSVRHGFALRCDDLALIDAASADELFESGLRAIIDLRSRAEVELSGRGVLAELPVAYHHVPLLSDIGGGITQDALDPVGIARMYVSLMEESAGFLVAALGVMAWSQGAVAFHCAAGKDRTGTLAAALLLALGADDETIVADYSRTEENLDAVHERLNPIMAPMLASFGIDADALARAAGASSFSSGAMVLMLNTLRERHGDPLAPLRAAGLDDALVQRLRQRAGLV